MASIDWQESEGSRFLKHSFLVLGSISLLFYIFVAEVVLGAPVSTGE